MHWPISEGYNTYMHMKKAAILQSQRADYTLFGGIKANEASEVHSAVRCD